MNVRRLILICAAASCLAASVTLRAQEPAVKTSGARTVAEFLQMREEQQLRARLVAEGRAEELRQLDQDRASRRLALQQQFIARTNEELGGTQRTNAFGAAAAGYFEPR